ncbi:MAG: flagellar motor protein MotB, partial [Nitrospirota bacterium]|nr:flagellar motor protein MotB [Nitrospirota bacterium]
VSESIKAALNPIVSPPSSPTPFQVGASKPANIVPNVIPSRDLAVRRLRQALKALQVSAKIEPILMTEPGESTIVLSLPELVLFESGAAVLRPEALPFLQTLAEVLVELDRQVRVQGHTDNVPIRSAQFPSNWELSSMRAVMVVRALGELYGVPMKNLSAIGYADSRPLVPNETAENRAKNRRVEIVVLERKAPPLPERDESPATTADGEAGTGSSDIPAALRGPG